MVIHLMVSGRFQVLVLTEASSKKRAGIWMFPNRREAMYLDAGGLETLDCTPEEFGVELQFENRTLKRALTDPRRFSGIGNAYSDEILHAARLSPLMLTQSLQPAQVRALHDATAQTLTSWRDRLVAEFDGGAVYPGPGKVTAFRPDFAVHGKFGKTLPGLRQTGAEDRLRGKRDQLLRNVPKRRTHFGGSSYVALAQERLAEIVCGGSRLVFGRCFLRRTAGRASVNS